MKLSYEEVEGECGRLLRRDFTTLFRTGYYRVNGVVVPEYFREFGQRIAEMEIRDDDVWVCSYPKTGTTWTQEMVWCLQNNLDYEGAKVFLPERFPFLEHSPLFDYTEVFKIHPDMKVGEHVTDSVGYINKLPSPRFVKSHLPLNLLPLKLQSRQTKAKIIYVCRNPKDTCLSYFHHCCSFEGYRGNFEDFTKLYMGHSLCFSPYPPHIEGYWKLREDPNVLFLKYEDMKKDLISVIKRTAQFLGKTYSDEQMNTLSKHLSFESMKNNPAVNYELVKELNKKYNLIEVKGDFMRSGQVGEWKGKMSEDLIEQFNEWTKENFSHLDLNWE